MYYYFQYKYAIQLATLKHSYLNNFLSFQLFHADSRLQVFVLRTSGSGLISSMRLDGWNDIHSVKSTCSMLYLELKTSILPPLEGNDKMHKMNSNNYRIKRPIYQLHFQNVWAVVLHCHAKYDESVRQFV